MQKEIELKCLCDGLLDALREMGLGKYSLRNYYYEGMWPLINLSISTYRGNQSRD